MMWIAWPGARPLLTSCPLKAAAVFVQGLLKSDTHVELRGIQPAKDRAFSPRRGRRTDRLTNTKDRS